MATSPERDPTSIGNLLKSAGVTPADIANAEAFIRNNSQAMIGDALVHLGVITREQLVVALMHQRVLRSKNSKALQDLLSYATEHAKLPGQAADAIVASIRVSSVKLKKATG